MSTSERWIPFYMKGDFIDSEGRPHKITDAEFTQVLDANKGRDVALAIGHPKGNAPAMGWVNDYRQQGGLLFAKVKSLVPSFESDVKKGHWKKISASVTRDGLLNHIGFFGTQPTAMDGIPMVEFAAPEDATVIEFSTAEFADWRTTDRINTVGQMFGRVRDFIVEKFGLETADKVLSSYDIDNLKTMQPDAEPMQSGEPVSTNVFSKSEGGDNMKTAEQLQAELDAANAKIIEFSKTTEKVTMLEADLAAERKKNQVKEFSAFLGGKVKVGDQEVDMTLKVTPGMKPAILGLMEFMSSTESYEFAAAEPGKTEKKSPLEVFKSVILPNLKDQLSSSEFARKDNAGKNTAEEDQVVAGIAAASPKPAA
jgi:hypothetical protein